jgi:hypothetical protein
VNDLGSRVEIDAEIPLQVAGGGLFVFVDAVVGVAAVFDLVELCDHGMTHRLRSHLVVLADAEIHQRTVRKISQGRALGALDLLELVNGGGFPVVLAADALGEQFLDVRLAHDDSSGMLIGKALKIRRRPGQRGRAWTQRAISRL